MHPSNDLHTALTRKKFFRLVRASRIKPGREALFLAVSKNFVLGAAYLYYVKGVRCEGLETSNRLMSCVLRIPYKEIPTFKCSFEAGITSWRGWKHTPSYGAQDSKALQCFIDDVPHVLFILYNRSNDTYSILNYCETTGKHFLKPGFETVEECEEYVCKTYSGETGRCEIADAS